jgi:hypothetical protein
MLIFLKFLGDVLLLSSGELIGLREFGLLSYTEGKGSELLRVDISKHRPILSGLHPWETKITVCEF